MILIRTVIMIIIIIEIIIMVMMITIRWSFYCEMGEETDRESSFEQTIQILFECMLT